MMKINPLDVMRAYSGVSVLLNYLEPRPLSVEHRDGGLRVHFLYSDFMEFIGNIPWYIKPRTDTKYPYEIFSAYNGVCFFTLITQEEYDKLKENY